MKERFATRTGRIENVRQGEAHVGSARAYLIALALALVLALASLALL